MIINFTQKDYLLSLTIGFFIGLFLLPVFFHLRVEQRWLYAAAVFGTPFAVLFGVWLGEILGRWMPVFRQFAKFAAVGFLNTAIDFGTLNLLSFATGITSGFIIGGVNVPGLLVASMNSYLWNKLWVFAKPEEREHLFHDFPKFVAVVSVGIFLNSGMVIGITTYINPLFGLGPESWLNVAKVAATAISLFWTFFGFKFFAFR